MLGLQTMLAAATFNTVQIREKQEPVQNKKDHFSILLLKYFEIKGSIEKVLVRLQSVR